MEFENVIQNRFSVRKYKPEHLSQDTIGKILEAGHLAPTGCNYQPQRILVLNTDESISRLKDCTKCHFDAPTALVVCYNKDESWVRPYDGAMSAPVDAAIVTTHMMLAAYNNGVGSCWVMHFNPQKLCDVFSIPANIVPVAILTLGFPADEAAPIAMHAEVRDIEEIVFYDTMKDR